MSATYTASSQQGCGIPYKLEKIKGVKCRHFQHDLLAKFLTYPSSYLPPHFALHANQKTKKRSSAPWPTPNLLRHSNKNQPYVAANTIRRPSYRHCRSDYAGNRVENCTFIAVIEVIQRHFYSTQSNATTPLCRRRR